MPRKVWERCVNYGTVSYLICDILTTAADFAVYTALGNVDARVRVSQALSWLAAVLFAYVVNKLIVFRNYNMCPSYLAREVGTFVTAWAFSDVVTWVLIVIIVRPGGGRGFIYELFCKFTSLVINVVLSCVFNKLRTLKEE